MKTFLPEPPHGTVRLLSAYGIEQALVAAIKRLFAGRALDNEAIDYAPPEEVPPDGLPRIQSLTGKVAPSVYAGGIPLTVTGDIDPTEIPDYPAVIVSADNCEHDFEIGMLEVRILVGVWDRDKVRGGRVDCLLIVEDIVEALFAFQVTGEVAALVNANREPFAIKWRMLPLTSFPYYFGEIIARFELPTSVKYSHHHYRQHMAPSWGSAEPGG
jgi:hypothetical protein